MQMTSAIIMMMVSILTENNPDHFDINLDLDGNGVADSFDINMDLNGNNIPDQNDLFMDMDHNGIPDQGFYTYFQNLSVRNLFA